MGRDQPPATAARGGRISLLELFAGHGHILILSVLLYGPSSRTARTVPRRRAKEFADDYVALEIYAGNFRENFLNGRGAIRRGTVKLAHPKYTSVTEPFICPGSKDERFAEAEPFGQRKISYAYYMGRQNSNPPRPS